MFSPSRKRRDMDRSMMDGDLNDRRPDRANSSPFPGDRRGVCPLGGGRDSDGGVGRREPPFFDVRPNRAGGNEKRKIPDCRQTIGDLEERRLPTLPTGGSVPSAMASLTSLFGMGRGGSSPL